MTVLIRDMPFVHLGVLPDEFTVDVTRTDIHWGQCGGPECPVWAAVRRELWALGITHRSVSVGPYDVEIDVDGVQPSVRYTHTADEFIAAFDNGDGVKPQTVTLRRAS